MYFESTSICSTLFPFLANCLARRTRDLVRKRIRWTWKGCELSLGPRNAVWKHYDRLHSRGKTGWDQSSAITVGILIAECMNETVTCTIIHKVSAPDFHFEPNKMSYNHLWHCYTWCDWKSWPGVLPAVYYFCMRYDSIIFDWQDSAWTRVAHFQ